MYKINNFFIKQLLNIFFRTETGSLSGVYFMNTPYLIIIMLLLALTRAPHGQS